MEYELYLDYKASLDLNLSDYCGGIFEHFYADIMYGTEEVPEDENDEDYEEKKIGFISWIECNQVLARAYGIGMTEIPYIGLQTNSKALIELDPDLISKETIDEVGATINPNILLLIHFGISAAWRKKGMGEQVLKGLMKHMKGKYGYFVVLNPEPQQFDKDPGVSYYEKCGVELAGLENDPEKAQWKLKAFFHRCGFRLFKSYDNVFVCNIELAVPERIQVKRPVKRRV